MPSLTTQIDNAEKVEPLIKDTLTRIRDRIRQNMRIKKRNASMRSSNSLTIMTTGVGGTLWGSNSFIAMERGRGAGRVPSGFTNIIAQWIRDKGISINYQGRASGDARIRSVAWMISKKIRAEGTSLYRRGGFDDIMTTPINEEVPKLGDKILFRVDSRFKYLLDKFLPQQKQ